MPNKVGRPPLAESTQRISAILTADDIEYLDRINTNRSEAIRTLIKERRNMRTNRKYYAWANNDQGALTDVTLPMSERRHSLRAFEDAARTQLGSGWTVHIMAVDIDGDGQSVMSEPYEIKKFTIR